MLAAHILVLVEQDAVPIVFITFAVSNVTRTYLLLISSSYEY